MSGPARDPIAITALSSFSGFGAGAAAFVQALLEGRTSIAPIQSFDTTAARAHLASEIAGFDAAQYIAPAKLRRIDRIGRLAVAACGVALKDAGLISPAGHDDVGIAIGSNTSGVHSLVDYLDRLRSLGPPGASALDFSNTVGNAAASLCGIEFGMRGPNVTLSYKEASSFSAIAYAASLVRAGRARAMVTGGVDDIEPMLFDVHDRFGVLATDQGDGEASRPFDRRRNGFVMGTGAFMIVIESSAAAARRGATIPGELLGIGARPRRRVSTTGRASRGRSRARCGSRSPTRASSRTTSASSLPRRIPRARSIASRRRRSPTCSARRRWW